MLFRIQCNYKYIFNKKSPRSIDRSFALSLPLSISRASYTQKAAHQISAYIRTDPNGPKKHHPYNHFDCHPSTAFRKKKSLKIIVDLNIKNIPTISINCVARRYVRYGMRDINMNE